jgi:hypothetical protein
MLQILQRTMLVRLVELPRLAADEEDPFRPLGISPTVRVSTRQTQLLLLPKRSAIRGAP